MIRNATPTSRKVGYKRPPVHSRFKPGQSGNPRGRKPKACSADGIFLALLDEKITVKINGQPRRLSRREALIRRVIEGALNGDPRMIEGVFKIDRAQKRPERHALSKDDEGELDRALRAITRLEKRNGGPESK